MFSIISFYALVEFDNWKEYFREYSHYTIDKIVVGFLPQLYIDERVKIIKYLTQFKNKRSHNLFSKILRKIQWRIKKYNITKIITIIIGPFIILVNDT